MTLVHRRSRLAANKLLSPRDFIRGQRQQLTTQTHRLETSLMQHRQESRQCLKELTGKLDLLSPNSTLARGYSITRLANGKVVRTVKKVTADTKIRTLVTDGEFESVVG